MSRRLVWMVLAVIAAAGVVAVVVASGGDDGERTGLGSGSVGQAAYERTCAACHGRDLKGTATGPPLLHSVYAPGHHPDSSFEAAIARGSPAHHWQFGPMPAQPGLSSEEVDAVIAYVRSRQQAAGIS